MNNTQLVTEKIEKVLAIATHEYNNQAENAYKAKLSNGKTYWLAGWGADLKPMKGSDLLQLYQEKKIPRKDDGSVEYQLASNVIGSEVQVEVKVRQPKVYYSTWNGIGLNQSETALIEKITRENGTWVTTRKGFRREWGAFISLKAKGILWEEKIEDDEYIKKSFVMFKPLHKGIEEML